MATKIKGISIEIGGDTTLLQKSMAEVNKSSRDLKSELRDVEKLLKLDPGNVELVAQKQKILSDSIETTSSKLEQLKEAEVQVQKQFEKGEATEEQFRALQREVIKTEQELQSLEKASQDFGTSISRNLEDAGKKMQDFGGKVEGAGKKFAPVSAAAAGTLVASTKIFATFDDAMKQVQATMGGTDDDYKKLSKSAQEMGSTTRYSATEAADALNYLALAGYDTDRSIETLPKVLNLAQAGGLDLAYASDLVTDSMSALGLESNQLDGFIDELAKTSQKSNTGVGQLGEAILTVGGTAKILKGGTGELNTALGLLADNGIKGSEGGTALRNIILALTAPTDKAKDAIKELGIDIYDASGEMLPLQDIMQRFNTEMGDLSEGEKLSALNEIFGKVDLKSVSALMGTTNERWSDLNGLIEDSEGSAESMAATMESGIGGSFRSLKSAVEGLGISIGEQLAPMISDIVTKINKAVTWFNSLDDTQKGIITTILLLVAGIAPLLIIIGKVITLVGVITSALPVLGGAFTVLMGPVGIAIGVIAALVAIGVLLYKNWDTIKEKASQLWQYLKDMFTKIGDAIMKPINSAIDTLKAINLREIGANIIQGLIGGITSKISKIKDVVGNVAGAVTGGVKKLLRIQSPSKVMEEMGEFTGEGFANGIEHSLKGISKQTEAMGNISVDGVTGNGSNANTSINHSGVIRVEGVSNSGELNSVVDIVMDQLRREVRMA